MTLTLAALATGTLAQAPGGLSLLPTPNPRGGKQPGFFWCNARPPGTTATWTDSPDGTVCKITAAHPATVQYGTYTKVDLTPYAGKMVQASVMVRGNVAQGPGPDLDVNIVGASNGALDLNVGLPNVKKGVPAGPFDWTLLSATFRVPQNTGAIKLVCLLNNSAGEVEWKQVSLAPGEATEATQKTPEKFDTAQEAGATALAKYETY